MPIAEIEQILEKHNSQEKKIDELLTDNLRKQTQLEKEEPHNNRKKRMQQDVTGRNKRILQDLEITKANLRSKAIYSPYEMQWESILEEYKHSLSLPVTTYRCHLPVFV